MWTEREPHCQETPEASAAGGFSIVELMIGTVLMVVGVVGIMTSCIRLHALQRLDTEIGFAFAACQKNLEELRAVPLASLAGLDGTGFVVVGPDGASPVLQAVPGDADGLPGEIRVVLDHTSSGHEIYRLTIAVTWRGASGKHSIDLNALRGGVP